MRQTLIMFATASCLLSAAASAQSQSDADAAATASAHAVASATTDGRAVDLPAASPPASNATRAIANFTSLLREAALQAQAASQFEPKPTAQADPGKPIDPETSAQASRQRVVATSPS